MRSDTAHPCIASERSARRISRSRVPWRRSSRDGSGAIGVECRQQDSPPDVECQQQSKWSVWIPQRHDVISNTSSLAKLATGSLLDSMCHRLDFTRIKRVYRHVAESLNCCILHIAKKVSVETFAWIRSVCSARDHLVSSRSAQSFSAPAQPSDPFVPRLTG